MSAVAAVLFDLDGTLVDSAPDLASTLNDMCAARGFAPWPVDALRQHCGSGARGMLGEGLQIKPVDPGYAVLRDEFLNRYEQRMLRLTLMFGPVAALLDSLQTRAVPWGIVTNKAVRFAHPLCKALGSVAVKPVVA